MKILQLGLMKYEEALALMEEIHGAVASGATQEETLLIVEHPPVVTMGLRDRSTDLVTPLDALSVHGVHFQKIDRGGSVTVHEPGQLVIYPIVRVDARRLTVRRLVWALEEIMILECARWGVVAARDDINPGVWVGSNKVGAVGVRVANHVSKHGLALNISNTLKTFSHVVPCGIQGRGVTSLRTEVQKLGVEMNLGLIGNRMAADFEQRVVGFRAE